MKWQNEKTILPETPARADMVIHHSSATYSPKQTNKIIENKSDQEIHQHRWIILTSHWECEVCGRTCG